MDISIVDKNFTIQHHIAKEDIRFYSADEKPFQIYGVFRDGEKYRRMPEEVAKSVSVEVHFLHANTAGGRIRFVTDSTYVAINAKMDRLGKMPHFAYTGSIGFDLYADNRYYKTFVPPMDITDGYESVMEFPTKETREITINFPLYSNVNELYIGLQEDAILEKASPYQNEKPFVYYGSSITQGGCASRPGMSYQSIISRRFHCDFVNLGFSGSALAEDEMIDYVKNLEMSLFVYAYDHNAPNVEHLKNTHEKMFQAVRKTHPDIPIIILSRPKHILSQEEEMRRDMIEKTYQNAKLNGDKNVYFISGKELTAFCRDEGTVDGVHPTDYGFSSIAKVLGDVIEGIGC